MNRKLRVMEIIWNMNGGGAQKVLLNYLEDLHNDPDLDFKVYVYCKPVDSIANRVIREKYAENVVYLNDPQTIWQIPYFKRPLNMAIAQRTWKKAIEDYQPDIVHVHISEYLTTVLDPIAACGVPVRFDTLHSNPYRNTGKTRDVIMQAFHREHFVPVCVTKEQIARAKDHYGIEHYEVLYNGVDFARLRGQALEKCEAKTRLGLKPDDFVVLGVGRLNKIKNFGLLIRAFAQLKKQRSNAELIIAGAGDERTNLENEAAACGVASSVHLLGARADMPQVYSAADVLGMTSISEAAPLTLVEAQAMGLRCVISNGVPQEAIFTDRVNWMEKDADETAWAAALGDETYLGQPRTAPEEYEVHAVSQRLKDMYLRYWNAYEQEK